MIDNNRVEVRYNSKKIIMLLVISVLFFVAGLRFVIQNPQVSNRFIDNELFKAVIFYGAILMGAIGIYFFAKRLFDKKPPLILNEDGIYESISIYRLGFIPWADITDIGENSVQSSVESKQYFINIKLQHPDKYISSQSYLTKKLRLYFTNFY